MRSAGAGAHQRVRGRLRGALGGGAPVDGGRVGELLARGPALAIASERWGQLGIWVVGRGDAMYPVSGGARGVDETAMLEAAAPRSASCRMTWPARRGRQSTGRRFGMVASSSSAPCTLARASAPGRRWRGTATSIASPTRRWSRAPATTAAPGAGHSRVGGNGASHAGPADQMYAVFLRLLDDYLTTPRRVEDISSQLGLELAQVRAWLDRAVAEDRVARLSRPVRYQRPPQPP